MPTCFVIQPFDGDKYDKRYDDTFKQAIKDSGLTPDRVDRDPSVEIPIREIEERISSADICFAEITTDNPNVWYELGYALAKNKPVCMICDDSRSRYPFDIHHRQIVKYKTRSTSDFEEIKQKVTNRLSALMEKRTKALHFKETAIAAPQKGLEANEITALALLLSNQKSDELERDSLFNEMRAAGFTRIASAIAVEVLKKKGYVEEMKFDEGYGYYCSYRCTDLGVEWLIENQNEVNLREVDPPSQEETKVDYSDDIPF